VSGGEPTLQRRFVRELFAAVRTHPDLGRLTTFLDTNGSLPRAGWHQLEPWLDGAMVDVKAVDPVIHRRITGQDNDAVLDSVRWLHRAEKLHEIRLLVIPGVNDTDAEAVLERYAAFVRSVDPRRVRFSCGAPHGLPPPRAFRASGRVLLARSPGGFRLARSSWRVFVYVHEKRLSGADTAPPSPHRRPLLRAAPPHRRTAGRRADPRVSWRVFVYIPKRRFPGRKKTVGRPLTVSPPQRAATARTPHGPQRGPSTDPAPGRWASCSWTKGSAGT
jgi:hypothetical protein